MSTFYVKLSRGAWSTVLGIKNSEAEANEARDILNAQYQTDEYYVEKYDPSKK